MSFCFRLIAVEFAGSHNALHESKACKHGHCRGRTSSIGADRGDDGIWIYGFAGSFTNHRQPHRIDKIRWPGISYDR
jgi:hypothetical protein